MISSLHWCYILMKAFLLAHQKLLKVSLQKKTSRRESRKWIFIYIRQFIAKNDYRRHFTLLLKSWDLLLLKKNSQIYLKGPQALNSVSSRIFMKLLSLKSSIICGLRKRLPSIIFGDFSEHGLHVFKDFWNLHGKYLPILFHEPKLYVKRRKKKIFWLY